jgi:hypothetical protein
MGFWMVIWKFITNTLQRKWTEAVNVMIKQIGCMKNSKSRKVLFWVYHKSLCLSDRFCNSQRLDNICIAVLTFVSQRRVALKALNDPSVIDNKYNDFICLSHLCKTSITILNGNGCGKLILMSHKFILPTINCVECVRLDDFDEDFQRKICKPVLCENEIRKKDLWISIVLFVIETSRPIVGN